MLGDNNQITGIVFSPKNENLADNVTTKITASSTVTRLTKKSNLNRGAAPDFFGGDAFFFGRKSSAKDEIKNDRKDAVVNARKALRNSSLNKKGMNKRAANAVGGSLALQSTPDFRMFDLEKEQIKELTTIFSTKVEALWASFAFDHRHLLDATLKSDFGELVLNSAEQAFGPDGETLIICRFDEQRRKKYKGKFATYFELVDPDRLTNPNGSSSLVNLDRINNGIEVDRWGGIEAYHIAKSHPGDKSIGQEIVRVRRESNTGRPIVIHWFLKGRAGSHRGMPEILSAMRSIRDLDTLNDAELQALVVDAMLAIYIKSSSDASEILNKLQTAGTGSDELGELVSDLDVKMKFYEENSIVGGDVRLPVLPDGDSIEMSTSARSRKDTTEMVRSLNREQAIVNNLTYEMFTGDYSNTTFSSARTAIIDIWRMIMIDRILFCRNVPKLMYIAWLEEVMAREMIELPEWAPDFFDNIYAYSVCEFRGPGMGWVDPDKDQRAAGGRIGQGLSSYTSEASSQGSDFESNIASIAREHEIARAAGVILPTMPEFIEMTNKAGNSSENEPETADDDEDEGQDEETNPADGEEEEEEDEPES